MLYGDLQSVSTQLSEHVCEVLQQQQQLDRSACATLLDEFLRTEAHITAGDMRQKLQNRGVVIAETALNQALDAFVGMGIARELRLAGDGQVRYEHFHPNAHHDHMVCIKCGVIAEFHDEQLEATQTATMARQNFRPLFHRLEVYGICRRCQGFRPQELPISFAVEGSKVRVQRVEGGETLRHRFTELGFVPGAAVVVVKNTGYGALILAVKGARLAVGRGQAEHIIVSETR